MQTTVKIDYINHENEETLIIRLLGSRLRNFGKHTPRTDQNTSVNGKFSRVYHDDMSQNQLLSKISEAQARLDPDRSWTPIAMVKASNVC